MRVIFLTQDDPFYVAESFRYILDNLPSGVEVVAAVVLGGSPFGRRSSFIEKLRHTYTVFGPRFVWRYGHRFMRSKLRRSRSLQELLRSRGIEILIPASSINEPEFLDTLRQRQPDLLVSVMANQIFRDELIGLAPQGCLNLHSALLPRNRGLMPTFWALKHGETETGVSVFFVDGGIDTGPILVQRRIPIRERNLDALLREQKQLGAEAVVESLLKVQHGGFELAPNNAQEGNYNTFPSRLDVRDFLNAGNRLF